MERDGGPPGGTSMAGPRGDARPVRGHEEFEHAEANATLTRILGAIEEYVYTGEFLPDGAYRVVFVGPCRDRLLGMSLAQSRTAVWADYIHPADVAVFDEAHEGAHVTGRLDVEYRLVGADGRVRWVRDRGRMRLEGGRRFLDGSVLEVTAHKRTELALERARAQAHRLASIDPLTGVFNRRSLRARLAAASTGPVGVLSVDVDHFKHVNDLYGHAAGDAVLVAVAQRLRAAVRGDDAVFRMGGEEFLVLLPELPDDTALADIAETVRARMAAEPVLADGEVLAVTVSVGAARADAMPPEPETLLAAADRALYAAKRSGRDRVRLAAPDAAGDEEVMAESDALRMAEAMARVAGSAVGLPDDHLSRVSLLAARVARRLAGSPSLVLRCRLAGLLHDVGKVLVPAAVLGKPGPLDEEEWRLVRLHPVHGEGLLAAVPDLRPIAPIVRQHHERFDGTGYPDGLAGEEILLEARIVAVAECWIAMTSPRPHRPALSEAEALRELEAAAGRHLDARLIDALRSVLTHPREADARVATVL